MAEGAHDITGLILAGGSASRMQAQHPGADKGLMRLADRPLCCWLIDNLAPQVNRLLISANRHLGHYRRFGVPVVADRHPDMPGPLAGIHAGLHACTTDWLAIAACDTPFLPADWVGRLHEALRMRGGLLAYAEDPQQAHPLVALLHRSLLPSLDQALAQQQRRVRQWFHAHDAIRVRFEDERPFFNINTPDAWQQAQALLDSMNAASLPARPTLADICQQLPDIDPADLPVGQAKTILARFVQGPAQTEELPLNDALHRVLASPVVAPFDLPADDNAAMDGYALRLADLHPDTPTELPVAGRTLAGDEPVALKAGHAQRIMTGATMPAGADLVVMQEHVEVLDTDPASGLPGRIRIPPGQKAGQNVRLRGEDLQTGRIALPQGRRLQAADIGVAASLGLARLTVFRALRAGVISTGSELKQAGDARRRGQIYDSNRPVLLATLRSQGFEAIDLGSLPDEPEALSRHLADAAARVDVILSTGGAAGGDADFIRQVVAAQGEAMAWRLRLRPGRPLIVGRIGGCLLIGLPGNPVAALLSYLFVVNDALHQMAGAEPRPPFAIRARLRTPVRKRAGRLELQRVRLHRDSQSGDCEAEVFGNQSSAMLTGLAHADGVAMLSEATGALAAGDWIDVIPLHGLLPGGA